MESKKTSLLLIALLITISGLCQTIIVGGKEYTGRLSWSDYTGKVDRGSQFLALTSNKFRSKVGEIRVSGDSVTISSFEMILELDPDRSWVKPNVSDDLLTHEQGHFNIAILCIREIVANYKLAKLTASNFRVTIKNIISEAAKKYDDMQTLYDKETNHSTNKEQQVKWNTFISEKMIL